LFPPRKFDPNFTNADILNIDETAELTDNAKAGYRIYLPARIRQAFEVLDADSRTALVAAVRSITEDDIDEAVSHIPAPYFSPQEADLTARWLKGRLGQVDTLLDAVFPV